MWHFATEYNFLIKKTKKIHCLFVELKKIIRKVTRATSSLLVVYPFQEPPPLFPALPPPPHSLILATTITHHNSSHTIKQECQRVVSF